MLPVLIIRCIEHEGPGYLSDVLSRENIPMLIVNIDKGESVPDNIDGISGLVLMGGPMSVNDPLGWIDDVKNLVMLAKDKNLPVLGHCLGGQIIASALGADVRANPVSEIGWHMARKIHNAQSDLWLAGLEDELQLFHWHSETFDLPEGVVPVLTSDYCQHQGFVHGRILALQCHIEMTAQMVNTWCEINKNTLQVSDSVQSTDAMQADLDNKIIGLNQVADQIYSEWIKGLNAAS